MPRTYDPTTYTRRVVTGTDSYGRPITQTRTEAQGALQDVQHATALANTTYSPTTGNLQSVVNTTPNVISPPAAPSPTTAPTRSIAGQQALRTKLGLTDTSTLTPHSGEGYGGNTESTQDFEARKAEIEKQNTEKMNQYLAMQEEQRKQAEHEQNLTAGLNAPTTPPPSTPGATTSGASIPSGSSPSSADVPGSDQFTKAYQPILDALQRGDAQAAKDLVDSLADLPSEQSITDESALNRKSIDEFSGKVLDLSTREHDIALAREQETKLHQENANANAKALFEINQALQESQQREANIQSERKNRRIAAAMGITHDTGGLDWMAREERKGQEILTAMQQSGNVMRAQYAESARSISENYRLATQQADLSYDNNKITIQKEHDDAIRELAKTVSLEKKSRTDAIKEANKNFWSKLFENDMKRAEAQKDINVEAMKARAQADKDAKGELIKAKDTLAFTSSLRKEMEGDNIVQVASKTKMNYESFKAAWNQSEAESRMLKTNPDQVTRNASDQALITTFNKMLDPASVVRESEYDRTPSGGSLYEQFLGLQEKLLKTGGSGMSDLQRKELNTVARSINTAYDKVLQERAQAYFTDIVHFNSQDNLQMKVDPKSFPLFKYYRPSGATTEMWENAYSGGQSAYNTSGTENPEGMRGWLSPDGAPPDGYRTDRNNNPTAFVVALAKQAGLEEGVDYIVDPVKQNGFPTATLLGDPFEKTIRVIDKVGFYTKSGGQRWSHTAMSKSDWDALTTDQKMGVVLSMYQREGGTGELAANYLSPDSPVRSSSIANTSAPPPPQPVPQFRPSPRTGGVMLGGVNPQGMTFTPLPTVRYRNTDTGYIQTVNKGSPEEKALLSSNNFVPADQPLPQQSNPASRLPTVIPS